MPRGGARPGAGRPKKTLADKLADGNPGKRPLTVLKFENKANKGHEIPEFLDIDAVEGGDILPSASDIYKMLADYIDRAGCTEFVAPNLIQDFAFLRRSFLECEFMNKKHGRIFKGKRSPYVQMSIDYTKAAQQIYAQIWTIIAQNSTVKYGGRNEFLELLTNRGF
jgi:hypothetical protein